MASFELPELPETRLSPQLFVGATSPLWAYFGAAAAGGVAYWWMTRWTQPANLEALFGKAVALPTVALEAAAEPIVQRAEAATEALETVVETLPEVPIGGESAPISPVVETLAAPEPASETAAEVAAEPVAVTPPEPTAEAAADPIPDPVGKPRGVRKVPPANGLEA